MSVEEKVPTEEEVRVSIMATDMLVSIQLLSYVIQDVRDALEDSGLFRHRTKQLFGRADKDIEKLTAIAFRIFKVIDIENERKGDVTKSYANAFDVTMQNVYNHIDRSVTIEKPLDKAMNMLKYTLETVKFLNEQLPDPYTLLPARSVYDMMGKYFSGVSYTDSPFVYTVIRDFVKRRNELPMTVQVNLKD